MEFKLTKFTGLTFLTVLTVTLFAFKINSTPVYSAFFDTAPVSWRIIYDESIPIDTVISSGGEEKIKNQIISNIQKKLLSKNVQMDVQVATVGDHKIFKTNLSGSTSQDDLNNILFSDLKKEINLIGGPAEIVINGKANLGQSISIILNINPSTGYQWIFADDGKGKIKIEKPTVYKAKENTEKNMVGMPMRQIIYLKSNEEGQKNIKLIYQRTWENDIQVNKHLTISFENLSRTIDLSDRTDKTTSKVQGLETAISVPELISNWLKNKFDGILNRLKINNNKTPNIKGTTTISLPVSFDWRQQVTLPPVRNQGACGSCWAFSGIGALEGTMVIQGNMSPPDLSEQYLVSCNTDGSSCNGGFMSYVHRYSIDRLGQLQTVPGAVLETDFPYAAVNGTCIANLNHPYRAVRWAYIGADYGHPTVDEIKQAIYNHGPVAVTVCAGTAFTAYRGGVLTTDESTVCPNGINHAVVLVGWDDINQAWILRNSWGPTWGDGTGHMLIRYGISYIGALGSYIDYIIPEPTTTPTPLPLPTSSSNDTVAPVINITSPLNGSVISKKGPVKITATANDNVGGSGMERVEFLVNNLIRCNDNLEPYTCNWKLNSKTGQQVLIEAKAYDKASNQSSSKITVIVR